MKIKLDKTNMELYQEEILLENMEIIASTPKTFSLIKDDREVSMSGQILVK